MASETQIVIEGPSGSLRLRVERYQFPEITKDEWDSNWLIIEGEAVLEGKPWCFRDPCLTTFEMQRLANWLDQAVAGKAEFNFCSFTEPNLDFEQVSGGSIRVAFSLEALPPWIDRAGDLGDIGFNVPIDDHLSIAAEDIRKLLSQFPVRARAASDVG